MYRLRWAVCALFLACVTPGCGEDAPMSTPPEETTKPEFAQQTADMMKKANAGSMDLKKAQDEAAKKK
jgi:predicted small lipoprotein YifL